MKTVLTEYTGGVHYVLWPGRVSPYVAAGLGVVRLSASAEAGELPVDVSASESDITTNFGGGVRLFGGSSWGSGRTSASSVFPTRRSFVPVSVSSIRFADDSSARKFPCVSSAGSFSFA